MSVPSFRGPPRAQAGSVAERVGFEPTVRFPPHTLSKRAPSATRTPLRGKRVFGRSIIRRISRAFWGHDPIVRPPPGSYKTTRLAGGRRVLMPADRRAKLSSRNLNDLLLEAPAGRHIAQLHKDRQTLTESVCEFASSGLRRGDSVILIAAAFHTERYLHSLKEVGLDARELKESGQLVVRDSQELLGR